MKFQNKRSWKRKRRYTKQGWTQAAATADPQTNILQNLEHANQSILELGNMVQQQQMQLAQLQQQANVVRHQCGVCQHTGCGRGTSSGTNPARSDRHADSWKARKFQR